jgi:hypothetical protein
MNRNSQKSDPTGRNDLERVVEPLASYICATERPGAALKTVFAALLRSVEETNRVAKSHFHTLTNGGLA